MRLNPITHSAPGGAGFSLVELLVVVAIVGIVAATAIPVLNTSVQRARIVKAHSDLRQITVALELYRGEHNLELPPTRFSCSSRTEYELPEELAPYLPHRETSTGVRINMPDAFDGARSYRYRAPGVAVANESVRIQNGANIWVPDGFPEQEQATGRYYNDPKTSPVLYAVWSDGPNPAARKFDIPGRRPIPSRYWMHAPGDEGVVVHYRSASGVLGQSP